METVYSMALYLKAKLLQEALYLKAKLLQEISYSEGVVEAVGEPCENFSEGIHKEKILLKAIDEFIRYKEAQNE